MEKITAMDYIPKPGVFFYHFKHSSESVNNYAYLVVGIANHTETSESLVIYRPLYVSQTNTDKIKSSLSARPLSMWVEEVNKPELGYIGPRFIPILDTKIISELQKFI